MKKKLRFFDGVLKEVYERNGANEVQHEGEGCIVIAKKEKMV